MTQNNNNIAYSPLKNRLIARVEQRRNEINSFGKQQNKKLHQQIQSIKNKADKTYTVMNKANEKAAKKYGYMSNIAQIQKQLYDEGYFEEQNDPYAQHGGYLIKDDGTHLRVEDPWNYGIPGLDTDKLPFARKTVVGIKVKK